MIAPAAVGCKRMLDGMWHRLSAQERDNASRQRNSAILGKDLRLEPRCSQWCQHGFRFVQHETVDLIITPIQTPDLPEARDVARQDSCTRLNGRLDEDCPIRPRRMRSMRFTGLRATWSGDIEEKDPTRHERLVGPSHEIGQGSLVVRRIERVVHYFADCRDRHTGREVNANKRADLELRAWRPSASQGDHRVRYVDAHDPVSGIDESTRKDATAAAEIDHCATRTRSDGELGDEPPGRVAGDRAVALIVNVGKILAICVHRQHRCL
jgi:hypothetical protein